MIVIWRSVYLAAGCHFASGLTVAPAPGVKLDLHALISGLEPVKARPEWTRANLKTRTHVEEFCKNTI